MTYHHRMTSEQGWSAARPSRIRSHLHRRAVALISALGLVSVGLVIAPQASAAGGLNGQVFGYAGSIQTWSIPSGVQSIYFELTGGAGGKGAGIGFARSSTVTGTLTIPSGVSALDVVIGGQGLPGLLGSTGTGGWPNGGNGGGNGTYYGAGGGGSSDIRPNGAPFTSALIVVGGAGGSGGYGGTSDGGLGGFGGFNSSGIGQTGGGSDGGAGGAGGTLPNASTGQGGNGQAGSNGNNGGGGGGGGGWNGGAGGSAGTADSFSFRSGGGGGGGGGQGSYVPGYVAISSQIADDEQAYGRVMYLDISVSTIPSLSVGSFATWKYDAGSNAVYSIVSGSLPPGLSFDGNSGEISGVPTQAGTYTFTVSASTYPDGTNAVTTNETTTATVNTGGPADIVATSASDIQSTSATANGSILAGDAPVTDIKCVYSTTDPGGGAITGTEVAATPSSVNPTPTGTATAVSCPLGGLASNQTYYYQIKGTQSSGSVRSGTASFATNSAPAQPVTFGATSVTSTTAIGNGSVSATQNVSSIVCKAAATLSGVATGTSFPASPATTTGITYNQPVTCNMTGLTPNTAYHFAFFATDTSGTAMSPQIQSFITRVSPPQLGTISAADIGSTSAVVNGTVTPTNEIVTGIYCRYVASPGNPARGAPVAASPFQVGATAIERAASCSLSGLSPSTTYLVRMEATDRDGTSASANIVSFTTSASVQPTPAPTPTPTPTPTVKKTQKPVAKLGLPKGKRLKPFIKTVLLPKAVKTNAKKTAKVAISCTLPSRNLTPIGDATLCRTRITKTGKVFLTVTTERPVRVTVTLSAPATNEYTAYRFKKTYRSRG